MEGPKPARCPSQRAIRFPNRCNPQLSPFAEYGVPEGAGLRNLGSRRMVSFGESWNCRLEAAGAFVVALAARRSWFCHHQVFAVLWRFERRRTGLADVAALGRAFSWPGWWVLGHAAGRLAVGLLAGRAG